MLTYNKFMSDTPVTIDDASRFTTQYNLAVKNYLHRNFNKSFKLILPLIDELRLSPYLINEVLRVKIIKIYFTLISLLLNEITNVKLLKLTIPNHSINFPDYLSHAESILTNFNNDGLFKLVNDLKLSYNGDVVLSCLLTESTNKLKFESLKSQVESYLTHQGLYPGPINNTMMKNNGTNVNNNEKIMEFYLSEVLLKNIGLNETKEIIQRLFVIDDVSIKKWIDWIGICNEKINSKSNELPEDIYRDYEEENDDSDDAIYDSYDDYDDHDDPGYTFAETITANTATPNKTYIESRSSSTQTDITNTTFVDDNPKGKLKKSKSSKSKRSKSSTLKKSRNEERTKKDEIPITYVSKQISLLKKLSNDYLQEYTFFKLIILILLVSLAFPRRHGIQAKEKLVSLYNKITKTAQLAFKVSFM
ncbi:hypothetical protein C6P40_004414 [Pichia californica]|uniref:Uncharacterized protein n=1 Tax=Pichia californica TaxID=460514 RepID=A0A9P6WRN0_9ASCO|nr:hypothetical protein C6P40_004414 [[Candida] californica]